MWLVKKKKKLQMKIFDHGLKSTLKRKRQHCDFFYVVVCFAQFSGKTTQRKSSPSCNNRLVNKH